MVVHKAGHKSSEEAFEDARSQVVKALHNHVLDFKVNPPGKVLDCTTLFVKLFTNILQHPDEEKYRKVLYSFTLSRLLFNRNGHPW